MQSGIPRASGKKWTKNSLPSAKFRLRGVFLELPKKIKLNEKIKINHRKNKKTSNSARSGETPVDGLVEWV